VLVSVEEAAEAVAAADVEPVELVRVGDRLGQRCQWSGVSDALRWTVSVVERLMLAECVPEVPLVVDQGPVEQFPRQVRTRRFMIAFIRGIWTPLRAAVIPLSARSASNRAGNLPPRSRMRYRAVDPAWCSP
jgi:hypothetical protein